MIELEVLGGDVRQGGVWSPPAVKGLYSMGHCIGCEYLDWVRLRA